jgi:thiosulfate/3-mercaptopyruvate sulfurtransferase
MNRFAVALAALFLSLSAGAAEPLLTPQGVKSAQADASARVLDIRDPKSYAANHIPGSLNAPYGSWRGPESNPGELPSLEKLTANVQRLGITADTPVIVVSSGANDTDFGAAARVYWTLKVLGVNHLSVLNGGLKAWQAAGLGLDSQPVTVAASTFAPKINQSMIATREDVINSTKTGKTLLVDARPSAFYSGETRHQVAKTPGTLKGAVNVEHSTWFEPKSSLVVSASEAKKLAASTPLKEDTETISFCNTGHWAATNWFVMSELVGQKNVKLYAGSMVDWTRADSPLPMDNVPNRVKQLLIDFQLYTAK